MSRISRKKLVLTGNYASAYAAMHSKVEVVAAYPITPQTTVVEKIDELIETGKMDATMIRVDSEHSAMGAAIGASAAGARTYTATSSHGLLYMYENIWWAANARLPIVSGFITRTIGPPWNIWTDHQDFYTMRDIGWILFFAKNAQEIYDLTIQAFKIAEHPDVRLPVGIGYDAFVISHTAEPVELLNQEEVDGFLPNPRNIVPLLDSEHPHSIGNLPSAEVHYLLRKNIWDCMEDSKEMIYDIGREYTKLSGRDYSKFIDCYRCEDADTLFVSIGAMAGEGMDAVDILRKEGYRVGHMAIRLYRPFPEEEIVEMSEDVNRIIVFSRGISMGKGGILKEEISSTINKNGLYDKDIYDVIAGLAGTEVSDIDFIKVFRDAEDKRINSKDILFIRRGEYV